MNCIASRHPKFHQNIESDILKGTLEFDFCYIIYQFDIKEFNVAKWGLNGECLSLCRAIWCGLWKLDTRGTWRVWPHCVTWHVTMLSSRELINGCQYMSSASDQGRWWHEDWNCLMHSSLEMHLTSGNNDRNSSRIWSPPPQLIDHWSCSLPTQCAPGLGHTGNY